MRSSRYPLVANSPRPRRQKARLQIENLESRDVPASVDLSSSVLTYSAGSGINNNISIGITGTDFVITDSAETITTSIGGASGSGSNTVTVPTAGVTGVVLNLADGADKIAPLGAVVTTQDLSINHTGTGLTIAGPVTTTTGQLSINNAGTGGVTTSTSTVIVGATTFTANIVSGASWASNVATITTSAAHGLAVGQSVTIAGMTPTGYNGAVVITSVPTSTSFTYALTTNPGSFTSGGTAGGQETVTTSADHNLIAGQAITIGNVVPAGYNGNFTVYSVLSSTTFQFSVGATLAAITTAGTVSSGLISTTTGNISVSSNNALALAATLGSKTGTLTLMANQDGAGAEGLTQTAGTIVTTNTSATAASITANTAAGGTGVVSIDSTSIGGTSGGKLTVNSNGGSIVYPGTAALTTAQQGTANGGSAPTRVVSARDYNFTATGAGSIGTTARPIQVTNFGSDSSGGSTFLLNGGNGGVYWTKWGTIDGTLIGASATGAGGIRVADANASGDNLFITGNVSAASGNIYLAADDNFVINPSVTIGGAGFSGTVWIQANRDQGTAGQPLTMGAGSAIVTTSTVNTPTGTRTPTTQAIYLDISGDAGAPSPITLGNLTAGNGARIVVNAIPNGIANEAGTIAMADSTSLIDAGPTGVIALTAGITDTANNPALNGIGSVAVPIRVAGGNVTVASNLGSVAIASTAAVSITSTMTATAGQSASAAPSITLSTSTGALTIPAALGNVNNGPINVAGADGVVLNAQLGSSTTGAIGIGGPLTGSANIAEGTGGVTITQDADSTYDGVISGSQGLVKAGTGTLTFSTAQTFTGLATVSGGILNLGGSLTGAGGTNVSAGGTLTNTTGSVAGPVSVSGTLSPGDTGGTAALGTGDLSFGSGGALTVNINGANTPGTDYDQVVVTGTTNLTNAALRILVGTSSSLSIGQQFRIVDNDGGDAIVGQFTNGTIITAADNPLYKFTADYASSAAGGNGNDLVLTLTTILPPRFLDLIGGNSLSYSTGTSIDSTVSVAVSNGNYSITDAAGPISLGTAASSAGWSGDGTNTVTGPVAGITSLSMDLSDGTDAINGLDGGSAAVTLNATSTLTTSGTVTTSGNLTFINVPTLTLGGIISPLGVLTTTNVSTLNLTGTVTPAGAANLSATDITAGASSLLSTPTINLAAINSIGTASNRIAAQGSTIAIATGSGGVFLSEVDGANLTATATGAGDIDVVNASGTLNLTATAAAGDIVASETAGTLNIAGATSSTSGNISLTSGDAIGIAANLTAAAGTITIAANTDGAGSEGFAQTGGAITTGNTGTSAATITVNTAAGGTGDGSIDNASVGGASGGQLTINSNAGSILYAGAGALDSFQQGLQGNGGTEPTRVLKAGNYDFTTTGAGSIGTDARPIQSDNFNATNSGDFSAGTGGIYWTDWGSTAFDLGNTAATGAGNVRVVTANASGHNLSISGPVTTGSGSIYLAADDNFTLTSAIGGAGFSGTVYLAGNRDTGNTANLRMNAGASIITSNTTANAVFLEAFNTNGTRAGGITLNNITVGDGGTITATTNSVATGQGDIAAFDASVLLDAGPTGKIVFTAAPQAAATSSIGTSAIPLKVTAGTVVATSNTTSSTTGNTSGIFIIGSSATSFAAAIGGPNANSGNINLSTTSGVLTIAGATSTVSNGTITLAGADGVVINAPLGGSATGNMTINAGANQATLNSTLNLKSTQTLAVTAANGLVVSSTGVVTGTGAAANATALTVQPGGLISPAGTGVGTMNVGNTIIPTGSTLRMDINNSSSSDSLNVNGTIDVTGATLDLEVNGTINVNDTFQILTNDGGEAITGQFLGGTTVNASNDPRYAFTLNYNAGDGNDVVATLTSIAATTVLDISPTGKVTVASADGLNNNLTVSQSSGAYTITDTAGVIALSPAAVAAGWTGDGTQSVTGPVAGVTGLQFSLNTGNDTINTINAGSVPIQINGSGFLSIAGLVSTTDNITIAGENSISGNGTLQGSVLSLAANGIGSSGQRLATSASSIIANAADGGVFLREANGANVTATATGFGSIDVLNTVGTLNIAGLTSTASGNIVLSSGDGVSLSANLNSGSGTIAIAANTDGSGAEGFDQKAASLLSTNTSTSAVTITVNNSSGGTGDAVIGQGSVGSNSGGAFNVASNGGNILWSNDPSYTAFTAAQTGLTNGGSNTQTLRAYAYNLTTTASTGSIGTDARPLQFDNFGTNEAAAFDVNLTASAGTGGVFTTFWGVAGNDLTTGTVTAQGSGNIRLVAANSTAHNVWVTGTVSTGSGTISIYADDELTMTSTGLIGGAGFSGQVDLIANRDAGNGQSLNMQAGAAIVTSNATANAASLLSLASSGSTGLSDLTVQGGVVLTNVQVGDGGTITVNAAAGGAAARQGTIVQRNGTLVDAGPNGIVVLLARANDTTSTTNPLNAGNIGSNGDIANLVLLPITVRAGTVIATTNGTNLGNTGHIDVIDAIAGSFTATTTGSATAHVSLTTQAGALTVAGATTDSGGVLTLTGADGVVLNNQLGDNSTGAITASGPLSGNGNILLGTGGLTVTQDVESTFDGVISGAQSLTKAGAGVLVLTGNNTYSAGTTVSAGMLLAENSSGSATGAGAVTVDDGATLSGSGTVAGPVFITGTIAPASGGGGGTSVLNVGSLSFDTTGTRTIAIDLNGEAVGSGYDQVNTTGTIALDGATLMPAIGAGFKPLLNDTFVILASSGGVSGTFAGQPEGSTIDIGNRTFTISYGANDVELKVTHITSGPPMNTVPGDQAGFEDTTLTFSNVSGNAISVADPDLGGPIQVNLTATHGVLTFANLNGLTFSDGDGTADATMTFVGLTSAINAALDGLQFVPDTDYDGAATVSITSDDLGGTGDAPQTDSDSIVVTLASVNDAPSFTKGSDQGILEDAGPQTVSGWATDISVGPANESSQVPTFLISTSNDAMFSTLPTIDASGNLSYTTAPDANGTATITVRLMDDGGTANGGVDTSDPQTFTIDVTPVNDVPVFTKGADQTVPEDAGLQTVNGWATSISPGAANESGQVLTFHVSTNNDSLFSVLPTVDASGNLTYQSAANANGSATVTVFLTDDAGTSNGGQDTTASQTFTIDVTSVNDAPSFTKGSDQGILEDVGPQTVSGWATDISVGPANESSQVPTFLISTSNDAMFSALPTIDASGNLSYTTAPDANGTATITVRLMDDGGTANGGVDTSDPQTFTIDVTPVNDVPVFTKGADQTVPEDAGLQTVNGWATSISPGAANESGQVLTFHVSTNNDSLFSVLPTVDASGNLTYQSAANANGSATVTVFLTDDAGTSNGGQDTTASQTFTIDVTSVNDAPSFTKGSDQGILEDVGPQTVSGWATGLSAGPADESGQTLSFLISTDNDSMFAVLPSIDANGKLTYTPAPDANGSATVSVQIKDSGGVLNGGVDTSAPQTFTIDVTPVNDVPVFTKGANPTVPEDAGPQTVTGWATGISPGASNESSQVLTFHISTDNDSLFSTLPAIDASGNLTFTSAPNANGMAMATVYLTDDGGTAFGGEDTTAAQTFIINVGPVNDAPVLDITKAPVLPFSPVLGKVSPTGGSVSDLTKYVTDPDVGDPKGIAIVGVQESSGGLKPKGIGTWQYSVDGGASWTAINAGSPVSDTNALLLPDNASTRVRFLPAKGFTGFASISFKAWDQSHGAAGSKIDTTTMGDSAFSADSDKGWIAVGKVKTTIDLDGDTVLKPILPTFKATSKIAPLASVKASDLLGIAGLEAVSTPKGGLGVAILAADSTDGHWEYKRAKLDTSFQPVAVGSGTVLLLRPTDLLRFVPTLTSSGAAPLTFKTWDPTSGVGSPGTSNISPTGTGFGVEPGTAVLDLTPVLDLSVPAILNPVDAGQMTNEVTFASMMSASRIVGTNVGVAIVGSKGSGTWEYKPAGGNWTPVGKVSAGKALFLDADAEIRFTAAAGVSAGTASLSFKAWDKTKVAAGSVGAASGSSVSKETELVTTSVANHAPTLDTTANVTLKAINATAKPSAGTAVSALLGKAFSDQDSKSLKGIAITGFTDNGGGIWQYSVDGKVWKDLGAVGPDSAVLLASTAKVRYFVTNPAVTGPATITYKAWDRSAGQSGNVGVDTTGVLLNMFSPLEETASISVTA